MFDKLRLFFNLDKSDKLEIISKGYGTPVKLLNKCGGTGYTPNEFVPNGIVYNKIYIKELTLLTDKNKQVKVFSMAVNNDNRCMYREHEIKIVGGLNIKNN